MGVSIWTHYYTDDDENCSALMKGPMCYEFGLNPPPPLKPACIRDWAMVAE